LTGSPWTLAAADWAMGHQVRGGDFAPVRAAVDRSCGGFWSLTMYDKDYFMLPDSPNGRTNIGTVNLDADELEFAADGSLTIPIAHAEPADAEARANWLPAPEGQFALVIRVYVPSEPILDGSYKFPDVRRIRGAG
jgi:hypothetical protein